MASAVLADEVPKIGAQSHIGHGGLFIPPFLNGKALEKDEPFAIDDIGMQISEKGRELWKQEVILSHMLSRVSTIYNACTVGYINNDSSSHP